MGALVLTMLGVIFLAYVAKEWGKNSEKRNMQKKGEKEYYKTKTLEIETDRDYREASASEANRKGFVVEAKNLENVSRQCDSLYYQGSENEEPDKNEYGIADQNYRAAMKSYFNKIGVK